MNMISQIGLQADAGRAMLPLMPNKAVPVPHIHSSSPQGDAGGHQIGDAQAHHAPGELTEPPRKRGRPRKATDMVTTKDGMPSAATLPSTEGAGGHTRCDAHDGAAPGAFTPADEALLLSLAKRRKALIKMRVRTINAAGAFVRTAMGFRTIRPDAETNPSKELDAAYKKAGEKVAKRAATLIKAIANGEVSPDPIYGEVLGLVSAALLSASPLEAEEGVVVKQMEKLVKRHPLHDFAKSVTGLGQLGLAVILSEARYPLTNYTNPAKLWKRLGLGLVQHSDGGWRTQGRPGSSATAEEWKLHGYNPERRAQLFAVVGDPLAKHQNRRGRVGPYGKVYRHEKAKALLKARIDAKAGIPSSDPTAWTRKRAESHAKRVMTKALVRDLWRVAHGLEPRHQ